MENKKRALRLAVLSLAALLFLALLPAPDSTAWAMQKKRATARSKRSKVSKSRRTRRSRASNRRSRRSGGRYVVARDRRGRPLRDKRGRIIRRYVAPPRPPAGTEIASERVVEIQQALAREGFYNGDVSGKYDEITKGAMRQYQTANKLRVTGLPTAQTLMKLGLTKRPTPVASDPTTRPRRISPPPSRT